MLALLSGPIVGPASFINRVLQPGFIPPGLSILFFLVCSDRRHGSPSIHADRNSKNVTLWDIAGAFTLMGCTAAILANRIKWHSISSSYSNDTRIRQLGVNYRRTWLLAGCGVGLESLKKPRVARRGRWET